MDDTNQQGADDAQQTTGAFQPQTPGAGMPPAAPPSDAMPGAGADTSMGQPDAGLGADAPATPGSNGMPAAGPGNDPSAGGDSTPPQPGDNGGMPPAPQQ